MQGHWNDRTQNSRYEASLVESAGTAYWLRRDAGAKQLVVRGDGTGFTGAPDGDVLVCPLSSDNARIVRERLPWLWPQTLGLSKSIGCGDRLGLATPGHVRAVRQFDVAPIFAQQSVRENARTGRTPQQVLDEAMWGVMQEGWRLPWGADADHLKNTSDIDAFAQAGYTLYTIDPGDHVNNDAHRAPMPQVTAAVAQLPWDELEDTGLDLERRYLKRTFDLDGFRLTFDRQRLWRAAAKYGRAVAHTVRMYRHLNEVMAGRPFELEVSVDETDTPTSPWEHLFVASELRRLGVTWVSLAPRYLGRFEKGVDYIGHLGQFETEFSLHAAIARLMGPYKLSLHSGSDKTSIYPIIARHAGSLVHLKTAGTSYLEALRAVAGVDPGLFCEILAFGRQRYEEDRATYHVSADVDRVPLPDAVVCGSLPSLLDSFDVRQVLHVTFGSVLQQFGPRLKACLAAHEEAHYAALEAHFVQHLAPYR